MVGFLYRSPPWASSCFVYRSLGSSVEYVAQRKGYAPPPMGNQFHCLVLSLRQLPMSWPSRNPINSLSTKARAAPTRCSGSTFGRAQRQQLASYSGGAGGAGRVCGWRRLRKYIPVFVGEQRLPVFWFAFEAFGRICAPPRGSERFSCVVVLMVMAVLATLDTLRSSHEKKSCQKSLS